MAKNYSAADHRFRFASWAAGRAYGRGMTNATVERGSCALERAKLRKLADKPSGLPSTAKSFDVAHRSWCEAVQDHFGGPQQLTYGRAAKLVNVYLKTLFLNEFGAASEPSGSSKSAPAAADHIHPPIDRLLLDDLAKASNANFKCWREFRDKGWTRFDKEDYLKVIEMVRKQTNGRLWQIEEHWKPRTN